MIAGDAGGDAGGVAGDAGGDAGGGAAEDEEPWKTSPAYKTRPGYCGNY